MAKKAMPKKTAITEVEYGGLQEAYDYLNVVLFEGKLPNVFLTYQRHAGSQGYFAPDRFSLRSGQSGRESEVALNPDTFIGRSDEHICSVLTHEMVHVWQQVFGKPSARGYHNKQWAQKMLDIGLMPSNTGAVGGKMTGQRMQHYVLPDKPFAKAFAELAAMGWKLNLQSSPHLGPQGGRNSKTKFTCPECRQNAWGKPDLSVRCDVCDLKMVCATPACQDLSDCDTLSA
jgi:hypothetical protein